MIFFPPTNLNLISQLNNFLPLIHYGLRYDVIDVDSATDYYIAACNIPHYCSEEVAVHASALILDCVRRITIDDRNVKAGKWSEKASYAYSRLSNLVVGTLGFGNIARKVASYMKAFGCRVMAYDPYLPDTVFEQAGVQRASKEDICRNADIISVHIPYNKETHHTLDQAEFAMMKDGVMIVNTARGGVINPDALCDALDSGKGRAAGLGVLEGEPVTDRHARNLQYGHVTINPHRVAQRTEAHPYLI